MAISIPRGLHFERVSSLAQNGKLPTLPLLKKSIANEHQEKKEPYVLGAALHPVCLRAEVENLARDQLAYETNQSKFACLQ